jgi:nucleotide-binding universal stress UspA family protein
MGSIICGVDDSESAKEAARVARVLGAKLGHRLVFVRVVEPASPCEKISVLARRLQQLTKEETEVDSGAGWLVDVGYPADRLVAAAAEEKASFIVLGSSEPRTAQPHSVAAEVSRRAPCPVVVVPPGADGHPTNGHQQTEFAGAIARSGLDVLETGKRDETKDPGAGQLAGGIVRFSLGSRTDGS